MSEMTIAAPLSGEEIREAVKDEFDRKMARDCHLNPALAYLSFEAHFSGYVLLKDNGRQEEVRIEIDVVLPDRPPNLVRQAAGLPIPTLVEDSSGRREVKNVKYGRDRMSASGVPQQDPSKPQQNPHPPGTPEHEKHEKERKEREEREEKEQQKR